MKTTTRRVKDGIQYFNEKGLWIGTLRSSVGSCGESTGIFQTCKTTTPLSELGIKEVDGKPVKSYL